MLDIATAAAAYWPFSVSEIVLAAHRENAVFRVTAAEGEFALRLHRQGYRSEPELASELQIMAMLGEQGMRIPKPLRSKQGSWLETLDGTAVSVLGWMPGRPLGETGVPLQVDDRPGTFFRLGRLIANMHDAFDAWERPHGFQRQYWDAEGLLGENPQWGRFWDNPMLDDRQHSDLVAVREKLRLVFARQCFDEGLIHADMVSENILVDGADLTVIDFDDSGFGFRLQDLATALVKHQAEPDFGTLRAALVEGYRTRRLVENADIDLFLLIRHLTYLGWIVPRMGNAGGEARSRHFIAQVMPRAQRFLEASTA
jgi:Ser/Thr protein kinase RdoA (MazF antagonist)